MRLLKLRFTNINSLAGTWEIDFTNADFKRSPLFAIIGPTGAGKSTILDAVSLALFATTPRLRDATSKLEGEDVCPVLTKGEKMTEARVRFESDGVEYLSRWSRRTKRTGKLSEDEVELIRYARPEDEEGEVIATKKNDWVKKIQAVTHMTFDIFTRSVLLAQGAFANFLKANEDQRANLLEKITGTDIYTDISIEVYKRFKKESDLLKEQQTRLEGVQLLEDSVREELSRTLDDLKKELPTLKTKAQTLEAAYRWRERLDALTREVTQKEALVRDTLAQVTSFEPQRQRATLGRQAARPYHDHQVLEATLQKLQSAQTHLTQLNHALTQLTNQYPQWEANVTTASEAQQRAKEARLAFEPDYQAMIKLDERLKTLSNTIKDLTQNEVNANAQHRVASEAYTQTQNKYQTLEAKVATLKAEAEQTAGDELLEGPLALLNRAHKNLEQLRQEYRQHAEAKRKGQAAVEQLEKDLIATHDTLTQAKTAYATSQHATQEADNALNALNAGNSYASTLERMRTISEEIVEARHLKNYLDLASTVTDVEGQLATSATNTSNVSVNTWWNATGSMHYQTIKTQINDAIDTIEAQYPGLTVLMRTDAAKHLEHLQALQASLATWTNTYAEAQAALRCAQKAEQMAKQALESQEALHRQKENDLELKKTELLRLADRLQQCIDLSTKEKADEMAARAEIPSCPSLPLDELCEHLADRVAKRRRLMEKLNQEERTFATLQTSLAKAQTTLESAKTFLTQASTALNEELKTKAEVMNDRLTRFGQTNPNEKRQRLDHAVESATTALTQAKEVLQKANTKAASLKATIESTTESVTTLTAESTTQRETFNASLAASGLADWSSVMAAYLPDSEIQAIESQAEALRLAHAKAQGGLASTKRQQADEAAKALSALTTEALKDEWDSANDAFAQTQRREIETASQLKADDDRRQQVAGAQREIEAQKVIVNQWATLNEMIGSHDGKKFRTEAQKVTFRVLLKLANNAMKTMTSRYQLLSGGTSGLALNVLDKDMGAIVRTSQNLSGGETFMVSLSLALGLSRMGGEHLRVDTLFLDEGFGTLDEQTLDKALYALETLQKSSGKLIGLISHVKSIRDRIDAQIVVTGRPGSGRSVLSGPGVRKLEAA